MAKYIRSISFIIGTVAGREADLNKCITSINEAIAANKNMFNTEIIVINQGTALKLKLPDKVKIISIYEKGLSRARNIGIAATKSDYLSFIDDDAVVKIDHFKVLSKAIDEYNPDAMAGRVLGNNAQPYLSWFRRTKNKLLRIEDYRLFMGLAHIISRKALIDCGPYDERFGVGAKFGSAEETDYFIRLIREKEKIVYIGDLIYYHQTPHYYSYKKVLSYAAGYGALCAKYIFSSPYRPLYWSTLYLEQLLLCAAKSLIAMILLRVHRVNSWPAFKGLVWGFTDYLKTSREARLI